MKKLFYGNINSILTLAGRVSGISFNHVNYTDEERSVSFFMYDTVEDTFNGKKLNNSNDVINFINDVLQNYTMLRLSSWYSSIGAFNKSFVNLVNFCKEAQAISYSFNTNDSNGYHFRLIILSLLGSDNELCMTMDTPIISPFLYESRCILTTYRDSNLVTGELEKSIARNMLVECRKKVEAYFSNFDENFSSSFSKKKYEALYRDNLIYLEYLYIFYSNALNNGLEEEIKDYKDHIDKFVDITNRIINTYKSIEKDKKEHKKFINGLERFSFSYTYTFGDNELTKLLLDFNLNLIKQLGINKQTLSSFVNESSRALSALNNLDGVENKDVISEKINAILKRNENSLNNNVFRFAYNYFRDDVVWSELNPAILKTHLNDEMLKKINVKNKKDTKYYDKIIEMISNTSYPYTEFASVILMINELKEDDFKNILLDLTSTLYTFIHKNLTAKDSYRSRYSYAKYFDMLKDKDGNFYNRTNVELLFRGLYDNSDKLNSNMKKKITIFCMQCGLDNIPEMKNLPKDYKSISMELKIKK